MIIKQTLICVQEQETEHFNLKPHSCPFPIAIPFLPQKINIVLT